MLIAAFTVSNEAHGTSYAKPKLENIYSPNKQYFVRVDPETKVHKVYAEGSEQALWSFTRRVWHEDYYVSNDGGLVAWVAWQHCMTDKLDDPAVIIYSRNGIAGSRSYDELCFPRHLFPWEIGPIGSSWRVWRHSSRMSGDMVDIDTVGIGGTHILLLSDSLRIEDDKGAITLIFLIGGAVLCVAGAVYIRRKKTYKAILSNGG